MLEQDLIPSFYFDGQVAALLDYLELRPEKEALIKKLITEKKLFIGPFYCLVDEFLTDGICFRKNLEIGMRIAEEFGCTDFIGYLADTFGHSQNIPEIFQEYGIDKAIVWRGCGKQPSEFKFGGINTVNLIRGYYMDIFSSDEPIDVKAKMLKENLDKIAKKSGDTLLLPIGADHLDVPDDIVEQIKSVNRQLSDYEIRLGSPFEYFEAVNFKEKYDGELRDNSKTFILQGAYSSRLDLKKLNVECSYLLDLADKLQFNFGSKYVNAIEYAYRLLLQNQAHDSICGCSVDDVHEENITRYKKILQIAKTIIEEIRIDQPENLSITFKYPEKYKLIEVERAEMEDDAQVISKRRGFPTELLHSTDLIPITDDYTTLYTMLKEFNSDKKPTDLKFESNWVANSNIKLEVIGGKINLYDKDKCYPNFIEFIRCKDLGDSYNFGPDKADGYEVAQIKSAKIIMDGELRIGLRIQTSFFGVDVFLNKNSKLLNFNFKWVNLNTNRLWQVRFNLNKGIKDVYSEDMNMLISRKFDQNYDIRKNLPTEKGIEAKTNTAPFQRFVWANGLGIITKGITEYEVFKNALGITILRSTGIISNPENPARTTPAGPPIEVEGLQMLKEIHTEFSIGFFPVNDWVNYLEEIYPQTIIF
jgi:hypothetical protein